MTQTAENTLTTASPYVPRVGRIDEVIEFTPKEKYFRFALTDGKGISVKPGQFMEVSVFGVGEAPISICSGSERHNDLEMCIRAVGDVTNALHTFKAGDTVGLRGPFGNGFDMDSVAGKDLLFVAGGLGLAPCRGFILDALNNRKKYGRVVILYGARSPKELLFRDDLAAWAKRGDCDFHMTVDRGDDTWKGNTGVITTLFPRIGKVDPANTAAFIIGPPIMFKFAVLEYQRPKWSGGGQFMANLRTYNNKNNYRLGNHFTTNLWASYKWTSTLSTSLRTEWHYQTAMVGQDIAIDPETIIPAGQHIGVALGINYYFAKGGFKGNRLAVEAHYPLYYTKELAAQRINWEAEGGWQKTYKLR